ncbi:Disease resistance protein (TIR-NBS-LRR class) family [Arabidopsis thaliana]|uniref:Protein VARIATION IN COMPOUND TRIGGERED ROOT growth response n=3 Tax=Arabidopsis thaliana TaxID=3702 RepID=VICTR_ARATH|nr:Disease resistance protein (TIR-NBS-LRR class) family [Arabidopsis thaliana]F4KHI3.1 RecName: Full=Protein VARIATION IN COMPOUND TRIGGERED ROOT growth response [Arabidopsis thaliana]AED95394.1 Disease resistance protein (TIR-NBS-LRR class) family [Arabidopsis thaliana]BAX73943.1 TIR-NBS-LRR class disease resistance protein family [Arabidopsis thaliana]|eukprot:NP_199464.2 Disease resistance protein (TIR-NBS-LRR class) family [Arabidopsis thaliana]
MASSSSSRNWVYDVFLSFSGKDVRVTFRSHFLKELDRKLISAFRDNEIERSHSLWPDLEQAIKDSRIAVVVFSKNYASSSWCLNELLEIVNCNDKIIIPVFYGVDPSQVRYQIGEFGSIFEKTCKRQTEEVKNQWKKALTDVANMLGFDSAKWDDEAKMIEEIANDVLAKLLLTSSTDSAENSIGIEDHIANMSVLLKLEAEEVRMVGIWGSSGIGKTTIARALFNQLSRHFPVSKFIDRAFVYKSRETYKGANPDDPNMKLHLQGCFLSEILGKKDIKIDHLGALGERLKHQKTLIIIDDLDDLVVLDSLVGKTNWFGCGSRIIVITNNKQFLRAHGIDHIYEVSLPSKERAQEMFCQSAFGENSPPEGFEELVVEIAWLAGSLPLGLTVFGSALRGRKKEYWVKMLPRLQNDLDGNIEETLKVSYDAIGNVKDQALFRLIACLFNHVKVRDIELLLADSGLDVNIALENLVDKSLIHVRNDHVEMHRLLQETGRNIVRSQSTDNPGEREFLVDSNDSRTVLSEGIGTRKVLGISLDTSKVSEFCVHENAFKGMGNLLFLDISSKTFIEEEVKVHLPEKINYYSVQPKQLIWDRFPLKCMPYTFLRNLVKLEMHDSKLEKLWEGAMSFTCLKELDMWASKYLKEIPDLSKATNIEKLDFGHCWSLVELPSSIRNLNKLLELNMEYCGELETLPTGFNLKSLDYLNFNECWKLRTFPEFATNISNLILAETSIEEYPSNLYFKNVRELSMGKADSDENKCQGVKPFMPMLSPTLTLLELWNIPNLVELSSSFQNLNNLERLDICYCRNLESLPTGINLESLVSLNLFGCSRLKRFPDISTNIKYLDLDQTGIEEVPWQIENFFNLTKLTMKGCRELKCVSLNIFKLKHLGEVSFSNCGALTRVDLSCYPSGVEMMKADNADIVSEETTSSLPDSCVLNVNFMDCVNLDREPVLHQQSIIFNSMILPGEEVPSYFTYRTSDSQPFGTSSSLPIPLLPTQLSQPFFRFRVCAVVSASNGVYIGVYSRFKGRIGNKFDSFGEVHNFMEIEKGIHLCIFDCRIRLYKDNVPLSQLNYDHVDINIHITSGDWRSTVVLKEWGIRLLETGSSAENRLGNPNSTLPHVSQAEEGNMGYYTHVQGLVNEIENSEDSGDNNVETERSKKRMRLHHFI